MAEIGNGYFEGIGSKVVREDSNSVANQNSLFPWLVLDVSGLAYRAFHSMRDLSYEGVPTAVTYGVLRDLLFLRDRFQTERFIFCFDWGKSKRSELDKRYKYKRRMESDEQMRLRSAVKDQIDILRHQVLPELGYVNCFAQQGYEADDLMAALTETYPQQKMVLVSSDHDLFQLLSETVFQWLPSKKKLMNGPSFERDWGVTPSQWPSVLALAGCTSDNVIGLKGVGIPTAIRYLQGYMLPAKMAAKFLGSAELLEQNLQLVKLPFPGTRRFKVQEDDVTESRWRKVMKQWGIQSLRY